jgi:hypothetical protein
MSHKRKKYRMLDLYLDLYQDPGNQINADPDPDPGEQK